MSAITPGITEKYGLSRSGLYRAVAAGKIERIARGIYASEEAHEVDWDLLEAVTRRTDSIICLTSALEHYDLTDEIPRLWDIAIPRGARPPKTQGAIEWHSFEKDTFSFERKDLAIVGSDLTIGIYSDARTVVDAFRMRRHIGYEVARDALREWLYRGGKPAHLISIANKLPRATGPLMNALEMLT